MPNKMNIKHYRGDTFKANIIIDNYVPSAEDVVKFGLKKNKEDAECIVTKEINPLTMKLKLESEDTQNLQEGTYHYDIQVEFESDDGKEVETFIFGKFDIIADVVK